VVLKEKKDKSGIFFRYKWHKRLVRLRLRLQAMVALKPADAILLAPISLIRQRLTVITACQPLRDSN
jgi:hypothetical protein